MTTSCKIIIKTNELPPIVKEQMERKKMSISYIKGDISKDELTAKGINIVAPIKIPNKKTLLSIKEKKEGKTMRFDSVKELMKELKSE